MSFEELSQALIEHFASGSSEWRVRQALSKRRQLESEPVADYAYSLRMHCAKLNLPRSEWTHYFVCGLRPEIREYVVLQQPENLEVAENYAKLKESVLSGSEKQPAIDAKQVSAQIVEELSKAGALKPIKHSILWVNRVQILASLMFSKTLEPNFNILRIDPILIIRTLISFANTEVQFFQQGDFVHVQVSLFVLVVVEEAIRIIIVEQNPIRVCHVRSVINDSITRASNKREVVTLGLPIMETDWRPCLAKK